MLGAAAVASGLDPEDALLLHQVIRVEFSIGSAHSHDSTSQASCALSSIIALGHSVSKRIICVQHTKF